MNVKSVYRVIGCGLLATTSNLDEERSYVEIEMRVFGSVVSAILLTALTHQQYLSMGIRVARTVCHLRLHKRRIVLGVPYT